MAGYPEGTGDRRVEAASLLGVVGAIFRACGMSARDAALLADALVTADRRGVHSHGALRVPDYVKKLREEGVDPRGRPRVVRERGAALVVDGGNSMGQIGCAFAMERAIERARETGVAFAAVGGSNHCGAMAYFAMMALGAGMIGLAGTNALPTMAPWGGRDKIVGINPLAVALPTGREPPFVYDASFSGSSHGKIRVYHQKGLTLPEGWAFDAAGQPTTDTALAIDGLLQPIGGFKGIGIAMSVGLLASLLSGAAYGTELGNMVDGPEAGRDGHFVAALDVAAFEDLARFRERLDAALRQIRESRPAEGTERLYYPGLLEHETAERHGREGIPLSAETLAGIASAARALGVDPGPTK